MKKETHKGFTLIELLVMVAILAILSTFSVGFYSRFLTQSAVANTSDQLAGELRKAQTYSMMGRQNSAWGVAYVTEKIILFKGSSYAARDPAFDESFSSNPNISITGFTEIVFARVTGIPNSSPIITITGADTTKTITINGQGVVNR